MYWLPFDWRYSTCWYGITGATVTVQVSVTFEYVAVKVVSALTPVTVTVPTPLLFVIQEKNEQKKLGGKHDKNQ